MLLMLLLSKRLSGGVKRASCWTIISRRAANRPDRPGRPARLGPGPARPGSAARRIREGLITCRFDDGTLSSPVTGRAGPGRAAWSSLHKARRSRLHVHTLTMDTLTDIRSVSRVAALLTASTNNAAYHIS